MNLAQVLLILYARRVMIMVTVVFTVVATFSINLLIPKAYRATTALVMNFKGVDSVTGMTVAAQLMPGYMSTQVDILASKGVALKVVDALNLAQNQSMRQAYMANTAGQGSVRDWIAERLLQKLEAVPSRESSVLNVSFTANDPQLAADVSNAFARAYQDTAIALKVEPIKQASDYFNGQAKVLRENLETAQRNLSQYQLEHGIVSADNRLDVESSRLNELSTQLVVVQGQLTEALSRQRQVQAGKGAGSPDMIASPLLQNLDSGIAQAEVKMSEVSERLGANHPQYQSAKAELDKLKGQRELHLRQASQAVSGMARIFVNREAEVRAALQAQKDRVLKLNQDRDQLAVFVREVDAAQRAYDVSVQRFNQTSLEGHANQTDVAILTEAVAPTKASGPKRMLNTVMAVFGGLLLGVALSFIAELLNRRLRSAGDLADALGAPVLATLNWAPSRTQSAAPRSPWLRFLARPALRKPQ